ncbi:MAG: polysaccharide biosynthesis protein [Candidatus Hydrogenedentes bacterium]|nr:polysaccharide biosynthesis protein [Candidatus Hydrogenedentota bacterium]
MPALATLQEYEQLATGRAASCFSEAVDAHRDALREAIAGKRVAIIGAAGSIGFSVVKCFLEFQPGALSLIDLSENNLVEVVRELRSSANLAIPEDFAALPIGLGSAECIRYFAEMKPFDYILNLSAIKHVRSEKDIYCLMRMIDTNVTFPSQFLEALPYSFTKFFSVSSDKATNPANLMGASKRVMEKVLLYHSDRQPFSSARFANVAFSDGSLPHGFLRRLEKRQPLSAPNDVKRYFISHEEAGQICLLSCVLGHNREILFPRMEEGLDEKTFSEIAEAFLERSGLEPVHCDSEDEARSRASELIPQGKWPCYYFQSETTGEKAYEEFYTEQDEVRFDRFANIGSITLENDPADRVRVENFMDFARGASQRPGILKADYVRAFLEAVPELEHEEKAKSLDQRM